MDKRPLGAARITDTVPEKHNQEICNVDIDEFWVWAEQHKDVVDFSAFPEGTLGKEPEWVAAARHASWLATYTIKKTPWTPAEDERLKFLLKMYRYTYADICADMGRSEIAVNNRIQKLKIQQRPLPIEEKKWTHAEEKTLKEMRATGYSWETIGKSLGRTVLAVRAKYKRLTQSNETHVKTIE